MLNKTKIQGGLSVTRDADLSLRGRQAVAIPEALGDCLASLAMTLFDHP